MKRIARYAGGKILSSLITGDIKTKLLFIIGIVFLMLAVGMAVAFFLFNLSSGEALWWSWTHILDPGSLGDDKDVLARRIWGSLFAIAGLVLLGGAFITLSEEAARSAMDRLLQGNIPKGISGHTIVAGKGSKLKAFVLSLEKLSTWQKGEKLLIVVPTQEELLNARKECGTRDNAYFIVDQIWDEKDNRLGLGVAKRILLLDNFGGDTGDMLKTILKIQKLRSNKDNLTLYAEVNDRTLANGSRTAINAIDNNDPSIEIHILNMYDASARLALRNFPLDCEPINSDQNLITLIIEGWTPFAQSLFWQTIRVAHYPSKPTRIIVVHTDAEDISSQVKTTSPGLWDPWCRQQLVDIQFLKTIPKKDFGISEDNIVNLAICIDDADKAFSQALKYRDNPIPGLKQIFVELPGTSGYRDVIQNINQSQGTVPLHAVGASTDFELAEGLDVLAKKIHAHYQKKYKDVEWSKLDETMRAWNRAPADHIDVKLRILTAMIKKDDDKPGEDEINKKLKEIINKLADYDSVKKDDSLYKYFDVLSRIEHDRWCAEKYADGWTYAEGDKDKIKKHNPCLVPYDNLPPHEQSKDWETMKIVLAHHK